jgi:hypothetical protein
LETRLIEVVDILVKNPPFLLGPFHSIVPFLDLLGVLAFGALVIVSARVLRLDIVVAANEFPHQVLADII